MHVLRMLTAGWVPGVFYAPMDAGAGGGETQMTNDAGEDAGDVGDSSGGDDGAGGDAGDRDATDTDDEDLLLGGDDDDQHGQLSEREQLQRLRKANRRLKSRYLKARPILERVKGQDLDSLVANARNFQELQRAAQSNPKLRALIYGGGDVDDQEPTRSTAKPTALPPLPTAFTAEALGFDPDDSPGNRVIANAIQAVSMLSKEVEQLRALVPTIQNLDRTVSSSRAEAERREWSGALDGVLAEVKKVAPGNKFLQRVTRDAIVGAYQTRAQHRQSPQAIVKQYLAELVAGGQITKQQAGQVSAATQSRMANHNRTLPRSPAGGGQPSGARGNTRPLLKDIHRKLRAGEIGPR